jgi:threonylcarbamoyladenosine tRNA methylthiotransferase MtaB
MSDILDEARKLVELGHQELVFTGVNIGTFVNGGMTIIDVLKKLEDIPDLKRIRISSIEPTTIHEKLVYLMADSEKICKHLHVPLQSGDDTILKRMRRKHTAKEFADFIEFVYKTVPDVGIGTDIMVGFPGEGEKEFINTKKLLADLPVSYYHVFSYSDRKGTGSYHMDNKVPQNVKKQRAHIMIEQGKRKKYTFYEKYLGKMQSVLFEQKIENNNWVGYTSNYINVEAKNEVNLHNKLCYVSFNRFEEHALIGKVVEQQAGF